MTVVWGTGHRPEDTNVDYLELTHFISEFLKSRSDIEVAICGMAAGFDLAWGMEALNHGIEVWSVRPWAGHKARREDSRRYEWIERSAARHIITNDSLSYPGPWVYDTRNRWMVDNADEGVAFWNGKLSGGTFNCIEYADSVSKPYTNIYPEAA